MQFVWIEPGSFVMGSSEDEELAIDFESPQHPVTIRRGFYLGQFEVTQGQRAAVTNESPSEADVVFGNSNPIHPAVFVTWLQVQELISQLNAAENDAVFRLPTEAKWEYAAHAGTTTRWSWGDDPNLMDDYACTGIILSSAVKPESALWD